MLPESYLSQFRVTRRAAPEEGTVAAFNCGRVIQDRSPHHTQLSNVNGRITYIPSQIRLSCIWRPALDVYSPGRCRIWG